MGGVVERGKSEARKGRGEEGKGHPKPALASSLEYYLVHTAWESEWGTCVKAEVGTESVFFHFTCFTQHHNNHHLLQNFIQ